MIPLSAPLKIPVYLLADVGTNFTLACTPTEWISLDLSPNPRTPDFMASPGVLKVGAIDSMKIYGSFSGLGKVLEDLSAVTSAQRSVIFASADFLIYSLEPK